jgi:hypothetical protein
MQSKAHRIACFTMREGCSVQGQFTNHRLIDVGTLSCLLLLEQFPDEKSAIGYSERPKGS